MAVVRFFAAAAEAAGVEQTVVDAPSTGALRDQLVGAYGEQFERVLNQCALLVDGVRRDGDFPIADDSRVDVLPPFAGG
ncbi:MAG: molybdopterin synthase sulfur carrier subunit [Actinobacteria bacterium HGW-Actinobacteria-4]|nr:MAG: molybdopterin synthase sulfur carrier subunit [Actinobacteria bacterium HGW-Actinobacteria-4]